MKKIYTLLCIAATMLVACAKENLVENDTTPQDEEVKYIDVTFGAEFPVPAELQGNAKTMLNSDLTVSWCEGDQIAVNCNGINLDGDWKTGMYLATFDGTINEEDPHRAVFSGTVHNNASKFIAIYPAANVKLGSTGDLGVTSNGKVYTILPTSQTAQAGSFTNGCALSYAIGDVSNGNMPNNVEFNNLCAILEFTMPDYVVGAQTVNIKSNDGTKMSGGCVVDRGTGENIGFKSFGPSDHFDRAVYDNVTVTAPETASKFYAVILPGSYNGGLTITVTTENGQTYSRVWGDNGVKEFKANHIYNLGTLGVVLDEQKVDLTVNIEQNIKTGSVATFEIAAKDDFKAMVKSWDISLYNSADQLVRKIEGNTTGKGTLDVVEDYKLLAAGAYYAKVSYFMQTGSKREAIKIEGFTAPQFQVEGVVINATPTLNYEGGTLNGTDVQLSFDTSAVDPDLAKLISWTEITLTDKNSVTYRTATAAGKMTPAAGKPYLPNGDYTLTAYFTLPELGSYTPTALDSKTIKVNLTPTFGVELTSAKTSYDYYKAGGADNINKANACHNMGIYELAANITGLSISSEVTTQMIQDEKFYYEWFIGDTSIGKSDGNGSVSGISMNTDGAIPVDFGNKNVICKLTFDNIVKDSGNIAVNITGLPWKETPPTNKDNWNFSGNYSTTNESFLELGGNHGTGKPAATFKKSLYIPSDIDTKVRAYIHTRTAHAGVWYTTTFEFNLAGSKIIEYGSGKVEKDQDRGYIEGNGTLKTSDNSISMNGTYGARMENTYIRVYDLQILYR